LRLFCKHEGCRNQNADEGHHADKSHIISFISR
jgi:hypothetical protein